MSRAPSSASCTEREIKRMDQKNIAAALNQLRSAVRAVCQPSGPTEIASISVAGLSGGPDGAAKCVVRVNYRPTMLVIYTDTGYDT